MKITNFFKNKKKKDIKIFEIIDNNISVEEFEKKINEFVKGKNIIDAKYSVKPCITSFSVTDTDNEFKIVGTFVRSVMIYYEE